MKAWFARMTAFWVHSRRTRGEEDERRPEQKISRTFTTLPNQWFRALVKRTERQKEHVTGLFGARSFITSVRRTSKNNGTQWILYKMAYTAVTTSNTENIESHYDTLGMWYMIEEWEISDNHCVEIGVELRSPLLDWVLLSCLWRPRRNLTLSFEFRMS